MKDLPLSKVYQLLEPGPVVLLATVRRGRANIMTMSWHMMVEFEPPLVACVVSNANHSFAALRATKECVIAIPTQRLAPKVVQTGTLLLPLNLHDHTSSTSAAQAVVRLNHLKLGLSPGQTHLNCFLGSKCRKNRCESRDRDFLGSGTSQPQS